jgi:hypothetical protein
MAGDVCCRQSLCVGLAVPGEIKASHAPLLMAVY